MNNLEFIGKSVDNHKDMLIDVAKKIWDYAEAPYQETKSSDLLCEVLREQGFSIEKNIADIPTAFTATFKNGTGGYIAGFLGEFDALEGLSQKPQPEKEAIYPRGSGHGCGHNLLGAGSLGAAIALKEYLVEKNISATVIYFGCAAEEGAGSKQFMARAGVFDNVDFAYTWHPGSGNGVDYNFSNAIIGATFEFAGVSSHAGSSPHLGRSALDTAELMSVGVNYLREHIIDKGRIHYAYENAGGNAPNVVQDTAIIKYEVRAPKVDEMLAIFERVVNVAKGAALMTDTKMEYKVTMAFSNYVPNHYLALIADKCFEKIGAPVWDDEDYALARKYFTSYDSNMIKNVKNELTQKYGISGANDILKKPLDATVDSYKPEQAIVSGGSTDVGDVSYVIPTLNIRAVTTCIGDPGHAWQTTAQSRSPYAFKGMIVAAKVMALSAIETMNNPEAIKNAKEFVKIQNGGKYKCPLPDYVMPPNKY